jgi:hypothetical protein
MDYGWAEPVLSEVEGCPTCPAEHSSADQRASPADADVWVYVSGKAFFWFRFQTAGLFFERHANPTGQLTHLILSAYDPRLI